VNPVDSPADLRKSFVHSVAWTAGVRWGGQLVAWVATLAVARILSPDDFGLVSMASVYLGIVSLVSEFGIGTAIVTLRQMPPAQLAQLNLAAVFVGLAAFGVSCLVALPMGSFYHAPDLPPVVIVMSVGFIIGAFRSVPYALLQRDMSFKRLALVEGAQSLLLSGTSVVLALLGFRYWTLVIGSLLSAALSTGLTLMR
jgi:PST family polysaccharide transporter